MNSPTSCVGAAAGVSVTVVHGSVSTTPSPAVAFAEDEGPLNNDLNPDK